MTMMHRGRRLSYQRISRRGLITSGVLAGVLAATGVPVQAQRRGGILRLAVSSGGTGWDPRTRRDTAFRLIGQGMVFDTLTEISASGELAGELAESWEPSTDARIWDIALRPGVTFHDGALLQASDVAASILAHRGTGSAAAGIAAQIADITVQDAQRLRITLHASNLDLPFLLADPHLVVAPEGRLGGALGTGLYRFDGERDGTRHFSRVAAHYKDGRAGWFDRVTVTVVPDEADRIALLQQGRVDAVDRITAAWQPAIAGDRDLDLVQVEGSGQLIASLPPALRADPAFARALQSGIDRAAVAAWLGAGACPGADHPVGLANPGLSPLAPPAHDPDAAAWLLAQTGIDVAAGARGLEWRFSAGRITEDWAFSSAVGAGGAWESTLGQDGGFLALLARARSETDSDACAALYADAQDRAARDGLVTVAALVPFTLAHSAALAHPPTIGNTLPFDGGRIAERWWFA